MHENLHNALAAREAARRKLEVAAAALERARETAAECQAEADRLAGEEARWIERHSKRLSAWIEGGGRGDRPVAAADAKAVQAQMNARANAAAAADALARFEAAERAAREALAAADAVVSAAAREVLFAEVRGEFDDYRREAAAFAERRERLFAAYLSEGRDALKADEWLELDDLLGFPSGEMDIGSPWLHVPLWALERTGERDRRKEARARIDALIPSFEARLAELASAEGAPLREEQAA